MKYNYKTVDTRTLSGLKRAEWLKSHGWRIISSGFTTIQFEKPQTPTMIEYVLNGCILYANPLEFDKIQSYLISKGDKPIATFRKVRKNKA